MKVYELMAELSELPAGAEVEFRTIMTLKEFADSEIVDNDNGADGYCVRGNICEVSRVNAKLVALYR